MGRPGAWRAAVAFLVVLTTILALFFHRSLLRGEIFSPADLLFSYYPWAYDGPRVSPANITRSDEALFHQPMFATHWTRLRGGDFPEWDPLLLGGSPAFFDGLGFGQPFSPLAAPFLVLAPETAVTVYAPLRLFVAAVLMWVFAGSLGVNAWGRAGAALAFAFNGVFLVWLSAPLSTIALFLPLTCLLAERTARRGRPADAAALALALAVQFTGAYLPPSFVVVVVTAAYGLCAAAVQRHARGVIALAAGGLWALAVAAVALVPMLLTLASSPVAARAWSDRRPRLANLATLAMPDFWGNPTRESWWYPGDGNYVELVAYAGVACVVLAGAGWAAAALGRRDWRAWFFAGLAAFVLCYTYGVPPIAWIGELPGLRSMNSLRWNAALGFAVAALCGYGIDAISRRHGEAGGGDGRRLARWPPSWELRGPMAGALLATGLLAAALGAGLAAVMDEIRARHLEAIEKAQIVRFAAIASGTLGLIATGGWLARRRLTGSGAPLASLRRPIAPGLLASGAIALLLVDLLQFGWTFNPTIPSGRYYPETNALRVLRGLSPRRIAPVGNRGEFPQGHIWSMYGLASITGFDFGGATDYQQFLARATGQPWIETTFGFLEIPGAAPLNLRLLGLLGVDTLVTAPVDAATLEGGYETVGELIDGRVVRQAFRATMNGLRRIDVLTATFDRLNAGALTITLIDEERGEAVASRTIDAWRVPNTDWLALDVPEQPSSRGRRYTLEVRAIGALPGRAATIWGSQADGYGDGALWIDGRRTDRDLWFRTFATAPDRYPGARLLHSSDLNLYRNTLAMPRAWFVNRSLTAPGGNHLDLVAAAGFDPASTVVVDGGVPPTPRGDGEARVLEVTSATPDDQRISVVAPNGGLLVISERFHPGWRALADGRRVAVLRADHLLMAVPLPPGTRTVTLRFQMPWLRTAGLASGLAALAALGTLAVSIRRGRSRVCPTPTAQRPEPGAGGMSGQD